MISLHSLKLVHEKNKLTTTKVIETVTIRELKKVKLVEAALGLGNHN